MAVVTDMNSQYYKKISSNDIKMALHTVKEAMLVPVKDFERLMTPVSAVIVKYCIAKESPVRL